MRSGRGGENSELEGLSVVVGLGATGLSCVRFLESCGAEYVAVDSRESPPLLAEFRREFPSAVLQLGGFDAMTLAAARRLIVSPGIALSTPAIAQAIAAGVEVVGDIALFARRVSAPILAVTGSNGKSTVVGLLAEILRAEGLSFGLGGNLDGENFKPALALLAEPPRELYVLELSSFQLETTPCLNAAAVALLNLSEDHMDRYADASAYLAAKRAIFNGASCAAVNVDDPQTQPVSEAVEWLRYSASAAIRDGFGVGLSSLSSLPGRRELTWQGAGFLPIDDMGLVGEHNILNALAAATLARAAGVSIEAIGAGIRRFSGLAHRCQWVADREGVAFFNDSKGTNVGAALASITGLGERLEQEHAKLVVIAGGDGKGADFAPLAAGLAGYARSLVLIGRDAKRIARAVEAGRGECEIVFASSMQEAVNLAADAARAGDAVLLSPACASFDMFENFQHRGDCFEASVKSLGAAGSETSEGEGKAVLGCGDGCG